MHVVERARAARLLGMRPVTDPAQGAPAPALHRLDARRDGARPRGAARPAPARRPDHRLPADAERPRRARLVPFPAAVRRGPRLRPRRVRPAPDRARGGAGRRRRGVALAGDPGRPDVLRAVRRRHHAGPRDRPRRGGRRVPRGVDAGGGRRGGQPDPAPARRQDAGPAGGAARRRGRGDGRRVRPQQRRAPRPDRRSSRPPSPSPDGPGWRWCRTPGSCSARRPSRRPSRRSARTGSATGSAAWRTRGCSSSSPSRESPWRCARAATSPSGSTAAPPRCRCARSSSTAYRWRWGPTTRCCSGPGWPTSTSWPAPPSASPTTSWPTLARGSLRGLAARPTDGARRGPRGHRRLAGGPGRLIAASLTDRDARTLHLKDSCPTLHSEFMSHKHRLVDQGDAERVVHALAGGAGPGRRRRDAVASPRLVIASVCLVDRAAPLPGSAKPLAKPALSISQAALVLTLPSASANRGGRRRVGAEPRRPPATPVPRTAGPTGSGW